VVVDELKFGDNDNLAVMIDHLMDAHVLVNLTDTEGLYDKDPRRHRDATLISLVSRVTRQMEAAAGGLGGPLGTGGMTSKVRAAKRACAAGVPMVVARGDAEDILGRLFSGECAGTFFVPSAKKMASKKCWIGFAVKPRGALTLDEGAVSAVVRHKKSLLPAGVAKVSGEFSVGDPVEILNPEGYRLGVGLVNYSAADLKAIAGKKTSQIAAILGAKPFDEAIHRDNLVVSEE
ncbi:MAG: glutamate 5-kinase, partial [Deltaproteobacteria bacterium]|nr:glutamate 5-kinase [Deltaproteobacteria bacterium]